MKRIPQSFSEDGLMLLAALQVWIAVYIFQIKFEFTDLPISTILLTF